MRKAIVIVFIAGWLGEGGISEMDKQDTWVSELDGEQPTDGSEADKTCSVYPYLEVIWVS